MMTPVKSRNGATGLLTVLLALLMPVAIAGVEDPVAEKMRAQVQAYFDTCFADLAKVAAQAPTTDTYRQLMKPVAEKTKGFFGGTLIDPEFVIQEVYYRRDFLARGFDLKKVEPLKVFVQEMKDKPAPQLSEPGHGSLVQPRLVAMRQPIMQDGRLTGMVSMMVRTEAFLEAVGLDKMAAYRITCRDQVAEEMGQLSASPHQVTLVLPSTRWEILFETQAP